jgi:hypothetical protein
VFRPVLPNVNAAGRGEGRRIEPAISVARVVIEDRLARELKTVLHKRVGIPLSQLHLRNALLSLLHGRQSEQKTREGGAGAVVGAVRVVKPLVN